MDARTRDTLTDSQSIAARQWRPERCDRCGSQGFNLHQRASKALKDPLSLRADDVPFI